MGFCADLAMRDGQRIGWNVVVVGFEGCVPFTTIDSKDTVWVIRSVVLLNNNNLPYVCV